MATGRQPRTARPAIAMRIVKPRIAVIALLVSLVVAWGAPGAATADGVAPIIVTAGKVPLDWADTDEKMVGRLRYRGGLVLRSEDPRFAGLSALLVDADGRRFVAVSDLGHWLRGTLLYDLHGDLAGVTETTVEALAGADGRPLIGRKWRDAEALSEAPSGGTVVAFEHVHRLWLYPNDGGAPVAIPPPSDLSRAPRNEGIEALTLLADGRFLVLTEGLLTEGGVVGWIGDGRQWSPLTYATGGGFKPTGAATLPGGDVVVLERRYPPIGVRVRRLAKEAIVPGAVLRGEEIARLEGSLTVDNMEGVAARRGPGGETLVYLLSDDNASPLQRTYLLMFELVE